MSICGNEEKQGNNDYTSILNTVLHISKKSASTCWNRPHTSHQPVVTVCNTGERMIFFLQPHTYRHKTLQTAHGVRTHLLSWQWYLRDMCTYICLHREEQQIHFPQNFLCPESGAQIKGSWRQLPLLGMAAVRLPLNGVQLLWTRAFWK